MEDISGVNYSLIEENVDLLRIYKSIQRRAESFYKGTRVIDKKEDLLKLFFKMDKAAICNDIRDFSSYLYMQLGILLNFALFKQITLDKFKNDLTNGVEVINLKGVNTKLSEKLFGYMYPGKEKINNSPEEWMTNFISELRNKDISFTTKVDIFYYYYINTNERYKRDLLDYRITNAVAGFRNLNSHGAAQLNKTQKKAVEMALSRNQESYYMFFVEYYQILYKIHSELNKREQSKSFLLNSN